MTDHIQYSDNPARRLYRILDQALAGRALDMYRFWAAAFDVPVKESRRVYRCFAAFQDLLDEVEALVRKVPQIDHEYHLQNLPRLRAAIASTRFDGPATEVVSIIEGGLLRDTGYWAEHIERFGFAPKLEDDALKGLLTTLNELFDEVRAAVVNDELRDVVLDALEAVRRAIVEYWLHGSEGLREEIERAMLRLAKYGPEIRPHVKEPWFKKTWAFLVSAGAAVETGKKLLPLARPIGLLLGFDIDIPLLLD